VSGSHALARHIQGENQRSLDNKGHKLLETVIPTKETAAKKEIQP